MENLFECVQCRKVGLTPWQTCFKESHIKCHVCERTGPKTCPSCSDSWHGTRQHIVEKMAVQLKTPLHCSYPGCDFSLPADAGEEAIKAHFLTCPRRVVRCLYETAPTCTWAGTMPDFFTHMHNAHCTKEDCNRVYCGSEELEWHAVPGQIRFDTSKLKAGDDGYATFVHFLRAEDGSMGLLLTELEPVTAETEPVPEFTFAWYHKLVWYSKALGRFVNDDDLQLTVTLHHQGRRVESAVLDFGEVELAHGFDTHLAGISLDESLYTFLPMAKGKPMLADLALAPGVPNKRKREKEDAEHTAAPEKKRQKREA